MSLFKVPRFVLSGVSAGVGKSLISIGLAVALKRRGVSLSAAVVGPYLHQATVLRRICGRFVFCLDERLLSRDQINTSLYHSASGADILLIEGTKGLYDGVAPGVWRGSTAAIAETSRSPVFLIVDSRGLENSIAPLVKGFTDFARGFSIEGTIANFISPEIDLKKHRTMYNDALIEAGVSPLVGCMPWMEVNGFSATSEVSERRNLALLDRQFLVSLSEIVMEFMDLDRIVEIANEAPKIRLENELTTPLVRQCRIAYSDDSAFNFGFQTNIGLLKFFGADIVSFSPLADFGLPKDIGGIYITGGSLAEYARELQNNKSMKTSIKQFYDQGGIIYAEGAGAAFLCEKFSPNGDDEFEGVGIIAGTARWQEGQLAFTEAVTIEESILGQPGLLMKLMVPGTWELVPNEGEKVERTLRISKAGGGSEMEGYSPGAQVFCTFNFAHWGSNPEIARNIVDAVSVVRRF